MLSQYLEKKKSISFFVVDVVDYREPTETIIENNSNIFSLLNISILILKLNVKAFEEF